MLALAEPGTLTERIGAWRHPHDKFLILVVSCPLDMLASRATDPLVPDTLRDIPIVMPAALIHAG